MRSFASDNNAGIHPTVLKAISDANKDHVVAYGDDVYTERAVKKFHKVFGSDIGVFFVAGGTAANTLGILSLTRPFNAIICSAVAHINVDECGALEKHSGCKLLPIPTENGKITVQQIQEQMHGIGDQHHVQPRVVSLTQPTELGTIYTVQEIKSITRYAHKHNLLVHVDGARIANATASLGVDIRDFTKHAGVDVLSFGGIKNGMMFGEAVVFFKKELAKDFKFIRHQGTQLTAKMRFISAQFEALLSKNLWLKNAGHANSMAQLLVRKVSTLPGVQITQEVQANAVFCRIPKQAIDSLRKKYFFYVWNEETSEVRWMTSFDTTKEDIEGFVETLKKALGK